MSVVPVAAVPNGVPVHREPGATILPGLIDTHVHVMRWELPLFLAYGTTTVRDTGNDLGWILAQRSRADGASSPRILCLGPILDGPAPSHPLVSRACADHDAAVASIRELSTAGVDGIKLYVGLPTALLPAIVREAHGAGLKVSKHCGDDGVLVAGRAGVDEFFHLDGILSDAWPDRPPGWLEAWGLPAFAGTLDAQKRVADEIARLGMVSTPTLAYWDSQWRIRAEDRSTPVDSPHVPAPMVAWQGAAPRSGPAAERWRRALEMAQRFTGLLLARGVTTLAGTDVPCGALPPGLSLWREMALLAGSGMSVIKALQSATADAAAFLSQPRLGRLYSGAAADLVVVRGDPTRGIPLDPQVMTVLRGGVAHRPAKLIEEAGHATATVTQDPWSAQFLRHSQRQR